MKNYVQAHSGFAFAKKLIVLALAALVLTRKENGIQNGLLLKAMGLGIALPYIANSAGWILAEMGRQPWIVYGLQTVYEGVSASVSGTEVLISLIGFAAVYTVLAVVDVYLLAKFGVKDVAISDEAAVKEV